MASQTQRALARKAVELAEFIDQWQKWLTTEANNQSVGYFFGTDATMTLPASAVGEMVFIMRNLSGEVRKLNGNLGREKIRGRGHP
jgi:hypothetical protein